jgi:hypothetical protein
MKLHLKIDSTALGASGCLLKLDRIIRQGYSDRIKPAAMVYGIAVHKYCDTMFKTKGDIKVAKEAALKAFSIPKQYNSQSPHLCDSKHMLSVAIMYFENYLKCDQQFDLIDLDGRISSEMTFSFPIYEDDFMVVDLEGTSDGIGKIRGGCFAIRDLKVTSAWDRNSYFGKYELDRQLRIYNLALKLAHEQAPDSVLGKIGSQQVGGFIDAIFLKPTITDVKYERSPVFQFNDWDLQELRYSLNTLLERYSQELQKCANSGKDLLREGILNGACSSGKYMCAFRNICKHAENPTIVKALLEKDFVKKDFQPLHYND